MTGSYSAAGLLFLGLFLVGGAFSLYKNEAKAMSVVVALCAAMALGAGAMRW
jgi:hypothetical protein